LLYDYHVAMSMASVKNANPTEQEAYKLAVFERYGIDETKFESSLKYYMRHTERLKKIYENIDERLKKEAQAQGISASDFSQYGDASLKGDTANVWNRAKAMILMPQPPYNYHYFEVKTDTAFHKGDLLTLEFDPLFIVQDGTREGIAVFTVTFGNDSIATETARFFSEGHEAVPIRDAGHVGIKRVRGYFFMPQPQERSTTFRLLAITNIKLIRMHEQKQTPAAAADSTNNTYPIRNVGGEPVHKDQGKTTSDADRPVIADDRAVQEAMHKRGLPMPPTR
jgi:putative lipoprotein